MVAGTLEYMSPEQILSDPIDARADIYSFGIVLFRWLTAELPFDSGPMLRLFAHHLESRPPPPSWLLEEIQPGLEKLILAAMRKDPANRYASMLEVLADLECVITGIGEVYGAPMQQERDEYWPRTEQAKRACRILGRVGVSTRPPPPAAPASLADVPVEERAGASDPSSVALVADAISAPLASDTMSVPLASDAISNAVSTPVSAPVQSQVRSSEKPGVADIAVVAEI